MVEGGKQKAAAFCFPSVVYFTMLSILGYTAPTADECT